MSGVRLEPFHPRWSEAVSAWAPSAAEVRAWCARDAAPVPPEVVAGWSTADDVEAYVLMSDTDDGEAVAYGELWLDENEREVELARLLVAPSHRNLGVGRKLAELLAAQAHRVHPHLPTVCLRVLPDNVAAQRAYQAAGFVTVDETTASAWNAGQPTSYRWMVVS